MEKTVFRRENGTLRKNGAWSGYQTGVLRWRGGPAKRARHDGVMLACRRVAKRPQARRRRAADGLQRAGLVQAGVGALIGRRAQGVGAFPEHGAVEQDAEPFEQAANAGVIEMLQDGVQQFRVVLVGHEGGVCCCVC